MNQENSEGPLWRIPALDSPLGPAVPAADAARATRINRIAIIWAAISTLCLVLTCACVCLSGVLLYRLGRSPEHLVAQVDYPLTVREGERFDMTITLRNWGSTPITVTEISLGYVSSGALLDGLAVRKADEALTRKPDGTGYTGSIALAPGEQRQLVFTLEGVRVGEFGSPVEFTTAEGSLLYKVAVGVKTP